MKDTRFDTNLIHGGELRPPIGRAVSMPVFQSSTYLYGGETEYDDLTYIRLNNTPNHLCLHAKLAALEGGESALVTASGMAAITTTLMTVVGVGEHCLAQEDLYGGTVHFLKRDFPKLGREVTFFSAERLDDLSSLMKVKTKAIYIESVSNPLLKIPDFRTIVEFAKEKGLLTLIDNTFPTPFNFNPLNLGFDVVLHSATKYLNGHTDIVGGVVVGTRAMINEVTRLLNHLGASLDPHACFLLNRGLKTLSVRVQRQNSSALMLAEALLELGGIKRVIYPGLSNHPDHGRAKECFRGFGGMLSFEYDGTAASADAFLGRLQIPYIAPSLGGVETLVTRPVTTSHSGIPREDLKLLGIRENLIRVSVGLEDPHDLVNDFTQALS